MITLLSLLAFGDNLITASLLERAGTAANDIRVVGTKVTKQVAELLNHPYPVSHTLFDDVPAFYELKKSGMRKGFGDALLLRRWALSNLGPGDTVMFEKPPSPRNRWMVAGTGCKVIEVPKRATAYEDRALAFAPIIGRQVWSDVVVPDHRAKTLLINPSSRQRYKELSQSDLQWLIAQANFRGIETTLIDIDGSLGSFASSVARYLARPKLVDAALALKAADRYIGPDSFFLHLAYYYGVPALGFFPSGSHYFRPPGLFEQGCGLYLSDLENRKLLQHKLEWFLG